jgi:hypothetical protein
VASFVWPKPGPQRRKFQRLKRLNIKVLVVKRQGKWLGGVFRNWIASLIPAHAAAVTHYDKRTNDQERGIKNRLTRFRVRGHSTTAEELAFGD